MSSLHKSLLTSLVLASLATSPALADDDAIFDSCQKDLQMNDSECNCVLNEVHNKLKPNQLTLFVAMIKGDRAAMAQAQANGAMSGNDILMLTQFMTETPTKCKGK